MVEYRIDIENDKLKRAMRLWEREMPELAEAIFRRWGEKIAAHAKENLKRGKFDITSGAYGRTGLLAESIFTRQQREYVMEFGAGAGVKYAAAHEFGFSESVPVRAHTRNGHPVRAHQRQMNIKRKLYMKKTGDEFFRSREPEDIARGVFNRHKRKLGFE